MQFPADSEDFDPSDYGTVEYWFDVTQLTGISNGEECEEMTDFSGNSEHFEQLTGTKQAKYYTNIENGLPALLFVPANDTYYENTSFTLSQPYTYVVIAQPASLHNGRLICDYAADDTFMSVANNNYQAYIQTTSAVTSDNNAYAVDTTTLFEGGFNGSSSYIYTNDSDENTGDAGTNAISGLRIGSRERSWSDEFSGYIMEVIIYSEILGATDKSNMRTSLLSKWGLS